MSVRRLIGSAGAFGGALTGYHLVNFDLIFDEDEDDKKDAKDDKKTLARQKRKLAAKVLVTSFGAMTGLAFAVGSYELF